MGLLIMRLLLGLVVSPWAGVHQYFINIFIIFTSQYFVLPGDRQEGKKTQAICSMAPRKKSNFRNKGRCLQLTAKHINHRMDARDGEGGRRTLRTTTTP